MPKLVVVGVGESGVFAELDGGCFEGASEGEIRAGRICAIGSMNFAFRLKSEIEVTVETQARILERGVSSRQRRSQSFGESPDAEISEPEPQERVTGSEQIFVTGMARKTVALAGAA